MVVVLGVAKTARCQVRSFYLLQLASLENKTCMYVISSFVENRMAHFDRKESVRKHLFSLGK